MQITSQYIKKDRLELSAPLIDQTRIYLDTKYWIELQKEAENDNPENQKLLQLAYHLVDKGKCIFPISQITFLEIFKQEDFKSRNKNFEVIDRLSKGFSIIDMDELIYLQVRHYFESKRGNPVEDLLKLIWTKTTLLQFNQTLPVEFYNFISKESFYDWHNKIGHEFRPFKPIQNIDSLNKETEKHKKIIKHSKISFYLNSQVL